MYNKIIDKKYGKLNSFFDNLSVKIAKKLYSEYEFNIDDLNSRGTYTLYENGDFIQDHEDGFDKNRLCVILLYLSDDWKEGDGGELVIKNNENEIIVTPKLGNYAVLDFCKNNVSHEVNKVCNEFKRYTYIHFINFKQSDSQTYNTFIKDKKNFEK